MEPPPKRPKLSSPPAAAADSDALRAKLKARFEQIFEKYERNFSGIGDEVDLETGEIVVDNGHLAFMRSEQDVTGQNKADWDRISEEELSSDENDELCFPVPSSDSEELGYEKAPSRKTTTDEGFPPESKTDWRWSSPAIPGLTKISTPPLRVSFDQIEADSISQRSESPPRSLWYVEPSSESGSLKRKPWTPWTPADDALLRRLRTTTDHTFEELEDFFPGRIKNTIQARWRILSRPQNQKARSDQKCYDCMSETPERVLSARTVPSGLQTSSECDVSSRFEKHTSSGRHPMKLSPTTSKKADSSKGYKANGTAHGVKYMPRQLSTSSPTNPSSRDLNSTSHRLRKTASNHQHATSRPVKRRHEWPGSLLATIDSITDTVSSEIDDDEGAKDIAAPDFQRHAKSTKGLGSRPKPVYGRPVRLVKQTGNRGVLPDPDVALKLATITIKSSPSRSSPLSGQIIRRRQSSPQAESTAISPRCTISSQSARAKTGSQVNLTCEVKEASLTKHAIASYSQLEDELTYTDLDIAPPQMSVKKTAKLTRSPSTDEKPYSLSTGKSVGSGFLNTQNARLLSRLRTSPTQSTRNISQRASGLTGTKPSTGNTSHASSARLSSSPLTQATPQSALRDTPKQAGRQRSRTPQSLTSTSTPLLSFIDESYGGEMPSRTDKTPLPKIGPDAEHSSMLSVKSDKAARGCGHRTSSSPMAFCLRCTSDDEED